ncbi:hypothetical protein [Winogradskyella sp. PG-2]|uniref:hypothetical protein n=1 Tax=Winogradskyella sp. PG-2 TaxID=754409 RepID=UPI0004588DDC|nr:hypothetical protein [Winogradskyella sp. PG-2]BAO75545.1 hypothetical protein WPG_1315 [Winogradskyella sp. PG-2]
MKLFITSIVLIMFVCFGNSQNKSKHYVLPEFVSGSILMKDGTKQIGVLNYNALSGNFALKKEAEILALSETLVSGVDTVYVANRKFFRKDGKFYEFLLKSDIELYVEYKCKLSTSTEASSGYGGTSQTTSGRSLSVIENTGNIYALELPEGYNVSLDMDYWIDKGEVLTKITTVNQFKKLYQDHKKEFKTYRKKNKIDFKTPSTVLKLIEHLEAL